MSAHGFLLLLRCMESEDFCAFTACLKWSLEEMLIFTFYFSTPELAACMFVTLMVLDDRYLCGSQYHESQPRRNRLTIQTRSVSHFYFF